MVIDILVVLLFLSFIGHCIAFVARTVKRIKAGYLRG